MIGTMVLVLMGCGSAVFAGSTAGTVGAGVGTVGVALAFGLSVVAMAYAIGGISGCHINPAITLGVFLSGRMNGKDAGMYMLFQVIGAIIGSAILYALVTTGGHDGRQLPVPTASVTVRCYRHSSQKWSLLSFLYWWCWGLPIRRKGRELSQALPSVFLWYWCISYVSLLQVLPSIRHVASVRHCSRVEKRCRSYGCLLWRRL